MNQSDKKKKGRPKKRTCLINNHHVGRPKIKQNDHPSKMRYFNENHHKWICEVPDCQNRWYKTPNEGFVRFPTSSERVDKWVKSLKLDKFSIKSNNVYKKYKPSPSACVCEFHFNKNESLDYQTPVGTHISYNSDTRISNQSNTLMSENPDDTRISNQSNTHMSENPDDTRISVNLDAHMSENTDNIHISENLDAQIPNNSVEIDDLIDKYNNLSIEEYKSLLDDNNKLKKSILEKDKLLNETIDILKEFKTGLTIKSFKTETLIRRCLGVPHEDTFYVLLEQAIDYLKGQRAVYYGKKYEEKTSSLTQSNKPRKLTREQELIITLLILRQGVQQELLAVIFKVNQSTISRIFNMMINFLGSNLIFESVVPWVDYEIVKQDNPIEFGNITRILDAYELKVERPASMDIAPLLWSSYKHFYGVKFNVCVTPMGVICHLSMAYGSRTSDKQLTAESGLLDLLTPGECVAVDRGFGIEEMLLARGCTLKMPPRAQGNTAFDNNQLKVAKVIANQRILVEQVIGRLRFFQIINKTLPWQYAENIDLIMKSICALTNLLPPAHKRE